MSHFMVVAIMPTGIQMGEIEDTVTNLMAPYDENIRKNPYPDECWCIGRKARNDMYAEEERLFGDMHTAREWFYRKYATLENRSRSIFRLLYSDYDGITHQTTSSRLLMVPQCYTTEDGRVIPASDKEALQKEVDAIDATIEALFQEEFKERFEFRESYVANHSEREYADEGCEECNGTGMYLSTYNPLSKWDWWVIGGRWDGAICKIERESKDKGFNFGAEHHQLQYNTSTVKEMIENKVVPFAIITPEGEWIERGKMGWWAMVSNEKDKNTWNEEAIKVYERYKDHIAVGLDCHI